jgi:hypothetical protein
MVFIMFIILAATVWFVPTNLQHVVECMFGKD